MNNMKNLTYDPADIYYLIIQESKPAPRLFSGDPDHKDNSFMQFQKMCSRIRETPSYLKKTEIYAAFFKKGTGSEFKVEFK